jgi:hypothetical protein
MKLKMSKTPLPLLINSGNLSLAWAQTFLYIIDHSGKEIAPLVVNISGFDNGTPREDQVIRAALDLSLETSGNQKVETVANTIFPNSLWRLCKFDRHQLYRLYLKTLPRLKALEKNKNRRGLYFERLIAFDEQAPNGNQLEHTISAYNSAHQSHRGIRRSMLQASVFDPRRDHSILPRLGFPCLQHVTFVPQGSQLTLNALYATQQIFEKAYGNYLGLCRLGRFMAQEMRLTFSSLNCFIGVEKLDTIKKSDPALQPLIKVARASLDTPSNRTF